MDIAAAPSAAVTGAGTLGAPPQHSPMQPLRTMMITTKEGRAGGRWHGARSLPSIAAHKSGALRGSAPEDSTDSVLGLYADGPRSSQRLYIGIPFDSGTHKVLVLFENRRLQPYATQPCAFRALYWYLWFQNLHCTFGGRIPGTRTPLSSLAGTGRKRHETARGVGCTLHKRARGPFAHATNLTTQTYL